ncbi:MAG: alpha/beta hydrolase [Leucothrix sp.]
MVAIGFFYWNSLSLKPSRLANGARFEPVTCWFEGDPMVRTECGYMTTRQGDKVVFKLPVVVIRSSRWKNSASPMLHIAGGPGGPAYIDADSMQYWLQNFKTQHWGIDFVLYDQRGTGLSLPFIDCPHSEQTRLASLKIPLNASQDSAHFAQQMQRCYLQLAEKPADITHLQAISTDHSAEDIADLHDLLGVKQWVLMGVSYGTRLALAVAKRFPEKVTSLVLDSVYPPAFDGFETMVENGFKGIDKLLDYCDASADCRKQFPEISEQFRQALFQLVKSPLSLQVSRENPNLISQTVSLTAHRLILLFDYASYDSRLLKQVPAAIAAVLDSDTNNEALLRLARNYLEIELFAPFSEPVYLVTECKENGRFDMLLLRQRLQPYREAYPMLDWSSEGIFNPAVCKSWLKDLTAASFPFRQRAITDKPTLILSGELDSITPVEWGRHLSQVLPNSRHLEYPNIGHSVLTSSLCANDEVQRFLQPELDKTTFCNSTQRANERSQMKWQIN